MKFENLMIALVSVFFGISALTMGIAQFKNSEVGDMVLESIVDYENFKIISDYQTRQMLLVTDQLLITNSQQINRNYACLVIILAERMTPFNRTEYEQISRECISSDMKLDFTHPDSNISITDPLETYSKKIDEIWRLRRQAVWWQFGSIISFILGIACFILLTEKKVIDFSIKKKQNLKDKKEAKK